MDTKNILFVVLIAFILFFVGAGSGYFLWVRPVNARQALMPDPLAVKFAPIDPCGCIAGVSENADVPLGMEKAQQIARAYLQKMGNPNLVLKEIIVFSNNTYVRIGEKNSPVNAMELFIDSETGIVISEYSSAMNWNLKYPTIPDSRDFGKLGVTVSGPLVEKTIPALSVLPKQAIILANAYLKKYDIQAKQSDSLQPFYGYYIIEYFQEGNFAGMLSINGYTGEVFRHDWHARWVSSMNYQ